MPGEKEKAAFPSSPVSRLVAMVVGGGNGRMPTAFLPLPPTLLRLFQTVWFVSPILFVPLGHGGWDIRPAWRGLVECPMPDRCCCQYISDNSIIYKFKIYRYMIVCAITIILIAILLSLFLFRGKKCSIGKKIILIVCFSIGMYILFSIIMLLYFFLGDFSAEELW